VSTVDVFCSNHLGCAFHSPALTPCDALQITLFAATSQTLVLERSFFQVFLPVRNTPGMYRYYARLRRAIGDLTAVREIPA
jgi:hypothetical protein